LTEQFFRRFGERAIFFSRFVPVIRHLISIPAGIGRMRLAKFTLYTAVGAAIWNTFLAWVGYALGSNWGSIRRYTEILDVVIVVAIVAAVAYFVYRQLRQRRQPTV
ncbi:MAG: DedA family protein, partial [Patescibacteria group bacterium]